jgi:hypothetical protein
MVAAIATAVPSANIDWVQSDCQHWLGRAKVKRLVADLGRFCGWATIAPWRVRIRHIVAREGTPWYPSRRSDHAIDCGPWSQPCSRSCLRRRSTNSSTAAEVCPGEDDGRRECSASPLMPSCRNRRRHL